MDTLLPNSLSGASCAKSSSQAIPMPPPPSAKRRSWYRRHPTLLLLLLVIIALFLGFALFAVSSLSEVRAQLLVLRAWRDDVTANASSAGARVNVNAIDEMLKSSSTSGASDLNAVLARLRPKRCVNGAWCETPEAPEAAPLTAPKEFVPAMIHLNGSRLSAHQNLRTELGQSSARVKDWRVAFNRSGVFKLTDGAVKIEKSGVFYLYSQFYFVSDGSRCSYRLRYGDGEDDFVTCIQDLNVSAGVGLRRRHDDAAAAKTPPPGTKAASLSRTQWRPCFLGFPQVFEKGTTVELELFDPYGICHPEKANMKRALTHSYWGIIQLGSAA